jgi:CubicO group peptidase (beta-lactamase class C family)
MELDFARLQGDTAMRLGRFLCGIGLAVGAQWLDAAPLVMAGFDRAPAHAERPVAAAGSDRGIAALLAETVKKHRLPGMAAAVIEGDHVIEIAAAGVRRKDRSEPLTVDDLVHIGSNAKSMTATVLATLVDEGRLKWDSSPADVLRGDGIDEIDPSWKEVTLEELLRHRSGIQANPAFLSILASHFLSSGPAKDRRDACRAILRRPTEHKPGAEFLYSNAGYMMAGAMAERVTGQAWEDLVRKRLFSPLGIASAGFGPPGPKPTPAGRRRGCASRREPPGVDQPWGHLESGEPVSPGFIADNPPCMSPAGTIHLSLRDWAKFASFELALARGHALLVSADSIRRLHQPVGEPIDEAGHRYAMGWAIAEINDEIGREFLHLGSNQFWMAEIVVYPARNLGLLVVTNQGGRAAASACNEVTKKLLAGHGISPPVRPTRAQRPSRRRAARRGR